MCLKVRAGNPWVHFLGNQLIAKIADAHCRCAIVRASVGDMKNDNLFVIKLDGVDRLLLDEFSLALRP